MPDLITRERALRNLAALASPSAQELMAVDTMIRAASQGVEKYCQRSFSAQLYDELYNGTAASRLLLRHFPITSIERIACSPTTVLAITNTSSTNQRAAVKVTRDGLDLTRVASGVTALNSLAFSTYVTITSLNAAINVLGNGWASTIQSSDYNNLAAVDLRAIQGAMNAKDKQAELRIHIDEISNYEIDDSKGILTKGFGVSEGTDAQPAWHGGINYWRIIYTAGFETIPEDVQEACAQWTAALFWATKRDPGLAHEAIVGAESRSPHGLIPPGVIELLRPYRNHQIISFCG